MRSAFIEIRSIKNLHDAEPLKKRIVQKKHREKSNCAGAKRRKDEQKTETKDTAHLGDILQELHPTPAVCGLPKEEAYHFILNNEGYNRAYYTGIIGWLDPQGETTLYVNLRCMNITDKTATFYAGGGILPSSTVETEWEETQQKMNTMRNIL